MIYIKKITIVCFFSIIILLFYTMFNRSEIIVNTEIEPLKLDMPFLTFEKECYWIKYLPETGAIFSAPGLTDMQIEGFVYLNDITLNSILNMYEWLDADSDDTYSTKPELHSIFYKHDYLIKERTWLYSEEVVSDGLANEYMGNIYINITDKLLYFKLSEY